MLSAAGVGQSPGPEAAVGCWLSAVGSGLSGAGVVVVAVSVPVDVDALALDPVAVSAAGAASSCPHAVAGATDARKAQAHVGRTRTRRP
jgi:hypothetical protein